MSEQERVLVILPLAALSKTWSSKPVDILDDEAGSANRRLAILTADSPVSATMAVAVRFA